MNGGTESAELPRNPLIVGLGNPGRRYADTRHNLGYRVIGELSNRLSVPTNRLECNALIGDADSVVLALPQTFMNRSGYAVRCLAERRDIDPGDILVVYDEVSLELGRIRLRASGGAGGHRGMESVIQNLRTEAVPRLRLGILKGDGLEAGHDLSDFVLSPFELDERQMAEELVVRAADACQSWLSEGTWSTMNRFNS
jgi:PTH1 family peptidyl-tRNA hydrolase